MANDSGKKITLGILLIFSASVYFTYRSFNNLNATIDVHELQEALEPKETKQNDSLPKFLQENFLLININEKSLVKASLTEENACANKDSLAEGEYVEITDRQKLVYLLKILNDSAIKSSYDQIICDLWLEEGYTCINDTDSIDKQLSIAIHELSADHKILIAENNTSGNKNKYFNIPDEIKANVTFGRNGGLFVNETCFQNNKATFPMAMFQKINKLDDFKVSTFFGRQFYSAYTHSANSPTLTNASFYNEFIPSQTISIKQYNSFPKFEGEINSSCVTVEFEDIVRLPNTANHLNALLAKKGKKKTIMIGWFTNKNVDYCYTLHGPTSGALLLLSSYYSLYKAENQFTWWLYISLLMIFAGIFALISFFSYKNYLDSNIQKLKSNQKHFFSMVAEIGTEVIFHALPLLLIVKITDWIADYYHTHIRLYNLYIWLIVAIAFFRAYFKNEKQSKEPLKTLDDNEQPSQYELIQEKINLLNQQLEIPNLTEQEKVDLMEEKLNLENEQVELKNAIEKAKGTLPNDNFNTLGNKFNSSSF